MALDKVKPLKLESVDTGGDEDDQFPTSMDPHEDYVECRGLVLDDATTADETTTLDRVGDDMRFKDGNNTTPVTLSELLGTTTNFFDRALMDEAGGMVYVGDGEFVFKGA